MYQDSTEQNLKAHTGFQPLLIRLHNQLDFTLYNKVNVHSVVLGKEGYLYELNYIKAHYGMDFVGKTVIEQKVRDLDLIRDSLLQRGVQLLVVLAPGKASFFPEYIPDEYAQQRSDSTNYTYYRQALNQYGIPLFDAKKWFETMKPTAPYPLYPKAGIHWSKYGEYLVADSLIHRMKLMGFEDMPYLKLDKITRSDQNINGDYDLGESMNLLFKLNTTSMGYPEFHVENKTGKQPKVMVVADSYYSALYFNNRLSEIAWGNGAYWYYYQEVFTPGSTEKKMAETLDIKSATEKNDIVILMITDANLYQFGFGWIEALLKKY